MVSSQLVVLLLGLALTHASSTCNPDIIAAIQNSRKSSDDSKILDKLSGEYLAVYMNAGWLTWFLRFKCMKASYIHNSWGVNVNYDGLTSGKYNVTFSNGAIQFLNEDGEVSWSSYVVQSSANVFTLYTCTDDALISLGNFAVSTVNVKAGTLDSSSKDIQEGKDALEKLGIDNLARLPLCPTTI